MSYTQTTKEAVIKNLKQLATDLGREPTASDIDHHTALPTARQLQRRFGGLRALRQEAGFNVIDHTTGVPRQRTAQKAVQQSKEDEAKYHNLLVEKYANPDNGVWVSRQYAYQQWKPSGYYSNIACDTCIEDRNKDHRILIDFFSAKDEQSLAGSVRIKLNKLKENPPYFVGDTTYEVVFVVVNEHLNSKRYPQNIPKYVTILDINQFKARFLS